MAILHTYNNGRFINNFDSALLEYIKIGDKIGISSILQEVNPCKMIDSAGNTLLHFAAEYGNCEFAQQLIDSGIDVEAQNQMKQTALTLAVNGNREEIVRLLLEADADIFVPDYTGQCVLGKALKNKIVNENIVKTVLGKVTVESVKKSIHVSRNTFHYDCSLYQLMGLRNSEITRIFLEKGSLVNAKDPDRNETALHGATSILDLENIKLLLKYNADVNSKGFYEETPLARVVLLYGKKYKVQWNEDKALEAIEILTAAGAKFIDYASQQNMASSLLTRGSRKIVRAVLQRGIDLLFEDEMGLTSLHYLAKNRHPNILKELRGFKFDIDARDSVDQKTMLHYAVESGNVSSLLFLLNHGADINAKSWLGRTPLYLATNPQYRFHILRNDPDLLNDYLNCVEILLERGADPHILTMENRGWNKNLTLDNFSDELLKIITPLFANLAVLEASDRSMGTLMRNQIDLYPRLKSTFDILKQQVEEIKQIKIGHSVTLFDFLTVDYKKMSRFAQNKTIVSNLDEVMQFCRPTSYYHRQLHLRYMKFSELVKWRETLMHVVNEILSKFCYLSIYNVAEKIVGYLQDEKWSEIVQIVRNFHY